MQHCHQLYDNEQFPYDYLDFPILFEVDNSVGHEQ